MKHSLAAKTLSIICGPAASKNELKRGDEDERRVSGRVDDDEGVDEDEGGACREATLDV